MTFTFEGANPMVLVPAEHSAPIEPWPEESKAVARSVSQSIKRYLQVTESLAAEKYAHFRDEIPSYLSSPGNILIVICTEGVVVRYETKNNDKPRMVVTIVPQSVANVAAALSQNLVHIAMPESPRPSQDTFGVDFKIQKVSPEGKSQDLIDARLWFETLYGLPQEPRQIGAKPYCLLSVRNHLELGLQGMLIEPDAGEVDTGRPFISYSQLRLPVGWDCIEVFPTLALDEWNPDFAPLWAECDILGAALIAKTKGGQLSTLDPCASARRNYATLLDAFKSLLASEPDREQVLQTFLQKNPVLLCPNHMRMWPKLPLGATVTDFVFRTENKDYLLVELERSTLSLFRQDGHPTADFTHAHGQITDWKRYLEDNLATVQRELGLEGITPNPSGLLVIGRSNTLTPKDRRKLQTMASEIPKLRVMTYDDVYENAKAVIENLLGPIWDTGGSTQIYYPRSDG